MLYPDSSDHLQANASLSGIVIASHDSLGKICSSHTAVAFATAASRKSAAAGCAHTLRRYFKRLALLAAWPIGRNQPASPLTCEHLDVRPAIRERAGQRLLLRIQQANTSARPITASKGMPASGSRCALPPLHRLFTRANRKARSTLQARKRVSFRTIRIFGCATYNWRRISSMPPCFSMRRCRESTATARSALRGVAFPPCRMGRRLNRTHFRCECHVANPPDRARGSHRRTTL